MLLCGIKQLQHNKLKEVVILRSLLEPRNWRHEWLECRTRHLLDSMTRMILHISLPKIALRPWCYYGSIWHACMHLNLTLVLFSFFDGRLTWRWYRDWPDLVHWTLAWHDINTGDLTPWLAKVISTFPDACLDETRWVDTDTSEFSTFPLLYFVATIIGWFVRILSVLLTFDLPCLWRCTYWTGGQLIAFDVEFLDYGRKMCKIVTS